jgi:glycerol-3-phosphate dehydrogenase (NAD+)
MPLPWNLTAVLQTDANVKQVLASADYIVHSVPVQASRTYLQELAPLIPRTTPVISVSKGICTETLALMCDIIPEALGNPDQPCAFVSGPSFARELMLGYPTGLVAASKQEGLAREVASLFESETIRMWTSTDYIGVEVGGALKNPYAIAAGILEGLGLGVNTTALLVTRGIAEMNRLAVALGSTEPTLVGLSGIGDLMLTSFGPLSRNRTVGVRLGRGESIQSIRDSMNEVAEGVATTPAALALANRHSVPVPLISAVNDVLLGSVTPIEALMRFMRRDDALHSGPAAENILHANQRRAKPPQGQH